MPKGTLYINNGNVNDEIEEICMGERCKHGELLWSIMEWIVDGSTMEMEDWERYNERGVPQQTTRGSFKVPLRL